MVDRHRPPPPVAQRLREDAPRALLSRLLGRRTGAVALVPQVPGQTAARSDAYLRESRIRTRFSGILGTAEGRGDQ